MQMLAGPNVLVVVNVGYAKLPVQLREELVKVVLKGGGHVFVGGGQVAGGHVWQGVVEGMQIIVWASARAAAPTRPSASTRPAVSQSVRRRAIAVRPSLKRAGAMMGPLPVQPVIGRATLARDREHEKTSSESRT